MVKQFIYFLNGSRHYSLVFEYLSKIVEIISFIIFIHFSFASKFLHLFRLLLCDTMMTVLLSSKIETRLSPQVPRYFTREAVV